MSWRNASLVDVSLNYEVDTSKLEERLDEIEGKLNQDGTIEDKVRQVIDEHGLGEDSVKEIVQGMLDEHTHEDIDEDRVQEIFREMAHSEGEDLIRDTISNEGYVTDDDVDSKLRDLDFPDEDRVNALISDYMDSSDFVDRDAVLDILREEGLDTDSIADAEEVETLKRDVDDLARRFESYANKTDSIIQLNERVTTLEERVVNEMTDQRQANGSYEDRIKSLEDKIELLQSTEALVKRVETLEGSNETAVTFFGLIQKAFDLLMQGRRGQ